MKHQITNLDSFSISDEQDIFNLLKVFDTDFTLYDHKPIPKVSDADEQTKNIPGEGVKSLLLTNKKGNTFLVVLRQSAKLSVNSLNKFLNSGRLSFCKPDVVLDCSGAPVGSVNPFCIFNTKRYNTSLIVDKKLKDIDLIAIQPMRNDRTISVSAKKLWNIFTVLEISINWFTIE